MTREQSYNKAFENKNKKLLQKKAEYESALQKLSAQNPEFSKINAELSRLGAKLAVTAISGDSTALNDCMIPGEGDFDFKAFLEQARKCGYTGDAVIEVYRNAFDAPQSLFDSHKKLLKNIF